MKTLAELETLEQMFHETGLRGLALTAHYEAKKPAGLQYIPRYVPKVGVDKYCADTDRYLAEMRQFRDSGYTEMKRCWASDNHIKEIQKRWRDIDCEHMVALLVKHYVN